MFVRIGNLIQDADFFISSQTCWDRRDKKAKIPKSTKNTCLEHSRGKQVSWDCIYVWGTAAAAARIKGRRLGLFHHFSLFIKLGLTCKKSHHPNVVFLCFVFCFLLTCRHVWTAQILCRETTISAAPRVCAEPITR